MAWAELSALEVAAGSTDDAIEVLERGRRAIASDRFFVQELARLYATAERYGEAASEWVVMLAWGDPGVESKPCRERSPPAASIGIQRWRPCGTSWHGRRRRISRGAEDCTWR
jgi:hypothetical protein